MACEGFSAADIATIDRVLRETDELLASKTPVLTPDSVRWMNTSHQSSTGGSPRSESRVIPGNLGDGNRLRLGWSDETAQGFADHAEESESESGPLDAGARRESLSELEAPSWFTRFGINKIIPARLMRGFLTPGEASEPVEASVMPEKEAIQSNSVPARGFDEDQNAVEIRGLASEAIKLSLD